MKNMIFRKEKSIMMYESNILEQVILGNVDAVNRTINEEDGRSWNKTDVLGLNLLQHATVKGNCKMIKCLLDKKLNPNSIDKCYKNTPLHEAVKNGYSQTVNLLLEFGANVNFPNKMGMRPLHLSAQKGHSQCCRNLIKFGANTNLVNIYKDTSLHIASKHNHSTIVKILLTAGSQINAQNKNGDTALHFAVTLLHSKIVTILLQNGANENIKNKQKISPLQIAISMGNEKLMRPPGFEIDIEPVHIKKQCLIPLSYLNITKKLKSNRLSKNIRVIFNLKKFKPKIFKKNKKLYSVKCIKPFIPLNAFNVSNCVVI
ncbi:Ankyrin repeat domain-containing protein 23 [Intoshia linei]|uniref:Ankyrin repeat domain-containing protein 23 n=1 Tax=Intoshia linei TaxID=1819745 RepID=A0A177B5U0_9BILA|nr:Ankyrin repeat domain-containing protein 23 [Intoshia linei]